MNITSIIFDLDGTLVESFPGISFSLTKAIFDYDSNIKVKLESCLIGPPLREILQKLLPQLNDEAIIKIEKNFRRFYEQKGLEETFLYDQIENGLSKLQKNNVRLFVATNKPLNLSLKILEQLNIMDYFEKVTSKYNHHISFENKTEVVKSLITENNIISKTTLFVGDSEDDAKAAFQNSISFIAVGYGYGNAHLQEKYPCLSVIYNFSELLSLINQL